MKSKDQKRILIIGGSGFIGKNSIIKFTEFNIGNMLNLDKDFSLLGVKTIYMDLRSPIFTEIRRFMPEYIIYLASLNDYECDDLNIATRINVDALERIYQELIGYETLKKFIYISDYKLYSSTPPFKENDSIKKNNNYLITKSLAEEICLKYIKEYSIPSIIFRASNIYGPLDQKKNDIISNMIKQALRTDNIIIENNNIYDYLYISDFIKALIKSLDCEFCGIINIGSGKATETINIAKYISSALNTKIEIKNNTIYEFYLNDITKVQNILNWNPRIELSVGIDNTIKYLKKTN